MRQVKKRLQSTPNYVLRHSQLTWIKFVPTSSTARCPPTLSQAHVSLARRTNLIIVATARTCLACVPIVHQVHQTRPTLVVSTPTHPPGAPMSISPLVLRFHPSSPSLRQLLRPLLRQVTQVALIFQVAQSQVSWWVLLQVSPFLRVL